MLTISSPLPNETMTLEQLAEYGKVHLVKRDALTAWQLGLFLSLARKRADAEGLKHGEIGEWTKTHFPEWLPATLSRARRLYEKHPDPNTVTEDELRESYREICKPAETALERAKREFPNTDEETLKKMVATVQGKQAKKPKQDETKPNEGQEVDPVRVAGENITDSVKASLDKVAKTLADIVNTTGLDMEDPVVIRQVISNIRATLDEIEAALPKKGKRQKVLN